MDNDKRLSEGLLKADGIDPARATESERTAFGKMLEKQSQQTSRSDIWRIIMKSKITKLAAAVLIIAGLISLFVIDSAVTPAYAIDQTLEALQNLKTIHMVCTDWADAEFEMWIKLNPETGIPEYCRAYWPKTQNLIISRPDRSYQYNEKANYVQVNSGILLKIEVAPGKILGQLLKASQGCVDGAKVSIHREHDETLDKELIVAVSKDARQTYRIYIDPDTKLPVRLKGLNSNVLGAFMKDADPIEFNVDLADEIFDFEIPEGARIHDHDQSDKLLSDPQNGMSVKGMTEQQAAEKIVTEYFNALIAKDKTTAKKLSPVSPKMVDGSLIAELAETGELYIQPGCGIGKLMPCTLKYKDGSLKMWKLIIKARNIGGEESIVIASYYDSPRVILPPAVDNPDNGLGSDGLTDAQAAIAITTKYWKASIDSNWDSLAQLMPALNAKQWEANYKDSKSKPTEIVEIGQPLRKDDCTVGPLDPTRTEYQDDQPWHPYMPVVPCKIKYSDGQIKNPHLVVKMRNIDGKKSCVVLGMYGSKKNPEE